MFVLLGTICLVAVAFAVATVEDDVEDGVVFAIDWLVGVGTVALFAGNPQLSVSELSLWS